MVAKIAEGLSQQGRDEQRYTRGTAMARQGDARGR
jgi:hypothetical protein